RVWNSFCLQSVIIIKIMLKIKKNCPSLLFKSFYQNYIVNVKKQHDIIYRRLYSIYGSLLKKNGVRVNTMGH
ncbi:hypothetical protein HMPREF1377_02087, partial [Enterococcus faecium R494]